MTVPVVAYVDSAHREQVITLWNETFPPALSHNDPAFSIDKKLGVADGLFFVALAAEQVVGTVLAGYDGHQGWLYSVAVRSSHRRTGVGSALVRWGEMQLAHRGCVKLNLQVVDGNQGAVAFYRSLGFATEPRVSMGKRIPWNMP